MTEFGVISYTAAGVIYATLTLLLAGYLLARMVGAGKVALLKLLGINRLLAMTHSRAS